MRIAITQRVKILVRFDRLIEARQFLFQLCLRDPQVQPIRTNRNGAIISRNGRRVILELRFEARQRDVQPHVFGRFGGCLGVITGQPRLKPVPCREQSRIFDQILIFRVSVDDFDILIDRRGILLQLLQRRDDAAPQTGHALVALDDRNGRVAHVRNLGSIEIAELLILACARIRIRHGCQVIRVERFARQ